MVCGVVKEDRGRRLVGNKAIQIFRIADCKLKRDDPTTTVAEDRGFLSSQSLAYRNYVAGLLCRVEGLVLGNCTGVGLSSVVCAHCEILVQMLEYGIELASDATS